VQDFTETAQVLCLTGPVTPRSQDGSVARASARLLVELPGYLEHLLRRIVRGECRGHAGQVVDLAPSGCPSTTSNSPGGSSGERAFATTPDAGQVLIVRWLNV
jgi:hypothetical protein